MKPVISAQPTQADIRPLGMPISSSEEWLRRLLDSKYASGSIDLYNSGELVELLEKRVAKLLNKPASLFFPKGMIAQFAALKTSEEAHNNSNFVLHPMSHLALDEADAYEKLLKLQGIFLGEPHAPFHFAQVDQLKIPIATMMVEIPLRRAGFKITPWDELQKLSHWCKNNQVHFHMDGARLWESADYFQKSEAEISSLFDSVYVSLYKGLGAIGGAVLAGEKDFIEQCKIWRTRLGGNSFTLFPMVISALDGLDNRREKMPELVGRAKQIAQLLSQFPQLKVETPQTNGFFVFVQGDIEALNQKAELLNRKMHLKLFNQFAHFPGTQQPMVEIQVGALHQAISNQEIIDYFNALFT